MSICKLYLSTDLEMLGLPVLTKDGQPGAKVYPIVQVQASLLDEDLETIIGYGGYAKLPKEYQTYPSSVEFLKEHGFFDAYNDAIKFPLAEIDEAIYEKIIQKMEEVQDQFPEVEFEIYLHGKSVYVDMEFMKYQMPKTFSLLSHRLADISTLRPLLAPLGFPDKISNTSSTHDAKDDVEAAIADHRVLLRLIEKLNIPQEVIKNAQSIEDIVDQL